MPSDLIELFSIGTELTLGQIQDTNAHWIAQQVFQLGGTVRRATMLRDNADEMRQAFSESLRRETGLILMTGGLGPTPDDMTAQIVAELTGQELIIDEETVQNYMERRQLTDRSEVSDSLLEMATVPARAKIYQNSVGWAPLVWVEHQLSTILMLPGPPREMRSVFEDHVASLISERYSRLGASVRVAVNLPESRVSPLMQEVMGKFPTVYLKAYVALRNENGMAVDIITTGETQDKANQLVRQATDYFEQLVRQTEPIL